MPWTVTLHIVSCASASTNLAGAAVTDGVNTLHADSSGQVFVIVDDSLVAVFVQISLLGFIAKTYAVTIQNAGTIQTICLDPSPTGTGDPTKPIGNSCFTGDTRITLADGTEKPMAVIREGDLILGRSGRTSRVIGIERPRLGDRVLYAVNGGAPFVTAEHPFLTEAGWKAIDPEATAAENPSLTVGHLTVRDVVFRLQGCAVAVGLSGSGNLVEAVVETISLVRLDACHAAPETELYNLLLDGDHAYFANGFIVHNKDTGCLIVSAATGSSESVEVRRLQQLRARVATVSWLGGKLIEAILRDYYQFSPRIAAELERDAIARNAVLSVVVRPLVAWYTLAGALGIEQAGEKGVRQAVQDLSSACAYYPDGASIITMLEAISATGKPGLNTPRLLRDEIAPRIRELAHLRFASWAILDPLLRTWQSATNHLDPVDQVAEWLATTPLEALPAPSGEDLIKRELGVLAQFFDFKPSARRQFGDRLMSAWPDAADELERAGFVSPAPSEEKEEQ